MFNVYPNPASGTVNIEFALDKPKDVSIIVTNVIGEIVSIAELKNVVSEIYTIDVSGKATPNWWPPVKVAKLVKSVLIKSKKGGFG